MKRKAITTSKKRVARILQVEATKIKEAEGKRVRDELTRYVYVDQSHRYPGQDILLGEAPEQPYVRVMLHPEYPQRFAADARFSTFGMMPEVAFRAVRKCWSDGKGTIVHWYDWERA